MNVLITGGSGKLGGELRKVFSASLAPNRSELEITNREAVDTYIEREKPNMVLHTAAYTSVASAEENKEDCWSVNVSGTENIVNALNKYVPEALFVYISTACVFYGDRGNYSEDDIPNPKNFYALTKLIGEYVAKRARNHLIARTNFVGREPWPYPKAFTDRYGTYLYADEVAHAIKKVIEDNVRGLLHIAGNKKISMFDLAKKTTPNVLPMTMNDIKFNLTKNMTLTSNRMDVFKLS